MASTISFKTWALILLSSKIIIINTRSITNIDTPDGLEYFLKYYGYAPGFGERTTLIDFERREAIVKFQEFHHLNVTGQLDAPTKHLMLQDRCDLPDLPSARTARFAIRGTKWQDNLRWKVNKADSIPMDAAERLMREAVQEWQPWMTLNITQSTDADSEILVEYVIPDAYGRHGDGLPFQANVLAHALYPGRADLSGDIHFNMKIPFSYEDPPPSKEYNLKMTAVHELGHAFGIKHSSVRNAIMYPYAVKGAKYPGLHADDILGLKALYGECFQSPCQNGGTCVHIEKVPGYKCYCPSPFVGYNCEMEERCSPNPCQNGGTCTNDGSAPFGYTCQCLSNFAGATCDEAIACQRNPCHNGGICTNDVNALGGYTCDCLAIYFGPNCEMDYKAMDATPCSSFPCQNDGTCNPAQNSAGYTCICAASYTGNQCAVDKCSSDPCLNGGTCYLANNTDGFTCACATQYIGDYCKESKCDSNPCMNGGMCNMASNSRGFMCACPDTHTGTHCESSKTDLVNGQTPTFSNSLLSPLAALLTLQLVYQLH